MRSTIEFKKLLEAETNENFLLRVLDFTQMDIDNFEENIRAADEHPGSKKILEMTAKILKKPVNDYVEERRRMLKERKIHIENEINKRRYYE